MSRTPTCPMCGNYLYVDTRTGDPQCARCNTPKPGQHLVSLRLLNRGEPNV